MRMMLFETLVATVLCTTPVTAQGQRDFWAYTHLTAESGSYHLPLLRVRGFAPFQGRVISAEYDFSKLQLKCAAATDSLLSFSVSVGMLNTPLCDVFPAPHSAFFSNAPEVKITPPFNDVGAVISRRVGKLMLTAGTLSGEGPINAPRTPSSDGVLLAKLQTTGLKLVALAQSGERVNGKIRRYGTAQAEWKYRWLTIGGGYAKRYDTETEASHAEVQADLGFVEVGIRGEKPDRLTAALVRSLGWKCGLQVEANFVEDRHTSWSAAFQYAIDFLKLDGGN